MRFDAFAKILVLEIDGGFTWVEYGKVNVDGVAMVEHWRFFSACIGDLKCGHQAVGSVEIFTEEALNLHVIHVIGFGALIDVTADEHRLPDPGLVELPKVVLCYAVVVAL